MDKTKIKVVAMDLDGTLTQHRQPLGRENRRVLDALSRRYRLLMVGAGQAARIWHQMGEYPVEILANYGLQHAVTEGGELRLLRDESFPVDRASVTARVEALRQSCGFTEYAGESVEFHPSGCITLPLLGTRAKSEEKLAFDPDRKKRRAVYSQVCRAFSEYCVFVGGSSSFDMAPKPHDKYGALARFCRENGLREENVVYLGDDYGPGGNDEAVFLSPIPTIPVDDYRRFPLAVKPLLD